MRKIALYLMAMAYAGAANAETINLEVWQPAASDSAAALRSIQVESFGGDAGTDLTFQVEDALRGIDLGQGPYFRVIPAAIGAGGAGLLRGTAQTEQRFTNYTEEHERCVRDAQGNCTAAKEKYQARCRRRNIELIVTMRLIDRDGTLLWSDNRPETYEDRSCEDSTETQRSRSAIARELAMRVAMRLHSEFAPRRTNEDIRVDESRRGLPRPDADRFRAAVRAVRDRNVPAACQTWRELGAANPTHLPTQFNIGLCAESAGDLAVADAQYRLAQSLGNARQGLERLANRARAMLQLEAQAAE